jgi:hypothetical protein
VISVCDTGDYLDVLALWMCGVADDVWVKWRSDSMLFGW